MKKFLSLVLALAMIISCVSMVSFSANAEEATDPAGIRITAKADIAATEYYRKDASSASNALFAEDDIVWDEEPLEGDVVRTGYIYRNYKVFNDGTNTIKFRVYYQGGNRGAKNQIGWDDIVGITGDSTVTVAANASADIKITIPVYELADGGIAVKVGNSDGSSIYTASEAVFADGTSNELIDYAPYWTISVRFQVEAGYMNANDTFVLVPEDKDDPAYLVAQGGNITLEKVYELPAVKLGDGTLEESTLGWGTIHGGSFSAVADPADKNNTVAKLTASGAYNSIFFDLGPYIFNDPDLFYNGHGAGFYDVTFKYKAESLEGYTGNAKFSPTLNSQAHADASDIASYLDEGITAQSTYFSSGSITMTEAWQTATIKFDVTDNWYNMMKSLRHSSYSGKTNVYKIGLRLDGGSNAFKDAQFNYFIDGVEIEYTPLNGMLFEITTPGTSGYPIFRANAGLTQDMADENNVLSATFDIYNMGENPCVIDIQYQAINDWTNFENSTADKISTTPGYKTSATINMLTDGNGNLIKKDGTVIDEIKDAIIRIQTNTAKEAQLVQKILIVPTNEVAKSIYNVKYDGNAGGFTVGGGVGACTKYFDEIPAYGTPTPIPTPTPTPVPTPHTVVNGDVSVGEVGATTIEGWTVWNGGTNTIVADGDNKAIHFVPTGMYSTTGFKVAPIVYNDGDLYQGHGIGTYTFSFRARLVNPVDENLDAATAKKAASFTACICSNKSGNYSVTQQNTYNTSGITFTMTADWQTFTVSIPVKEENYKTWTEINNDAKNLFLRFDASGSGRAFGYTGAYAPVEYMIDDVTFISYAPPATPTPTPTPKPTPAGLKLTSNTGLTASTYFNGGNLAAATGFTGTKEYTYKIHNVAKQAVAIQMSVQTEDTGQWRAAAGSETNVTIPADSFMIVTSTVTVTDGKVVVNGTNYDLSACWIRINQKYSAGAQEGDGIIIEAPNGDPLYNGYGGDVTKSEVYELPTYEPYTLVNGDVSQGEIGDTTIEGWTTWKGGSNTIIQDPADENNKVIKFVPTQEYSTTGFKVAPAVYNNGIRYFGNGLGVYTITLSARLEDASYLEGLEDATLAKATAFDVSLCGSKVYSHNSEPNSYNTNSKRIHLTGEWQTFTITIPVRDNNYNGWIAADDAANVFVRLDASGASSAFMYTGTFAPVNYLIDDVTIEYKGVSSGYLFEKSGADYYVNSNGSVFTSKDVVNNYITSTQTFYNPNDYTINLEYAVQGTVPTNADGSSTGWHGYGASAFIEPGQKATLTVKVPVNPKTGNAIITSGAYGGYAEVALSSLFMRINLNRYNNEYAPNGTQFVVEADYNGTIGTKYASSGWNKGWLGITPDFNIVGANLELGSTLTINYYASLGEGYEDAFMNFVRNGQTTSVEGVLVESGENAGLYKFAYTGINPQCMGDNVEAYLVNDGQNIAVLKRYSVKDYALNKYGTEDAKLDTLIADMLAYGAASQNHTGYKTDALVTDDAYAGIADWAFTEYNVDDPDLEPVKNINGNDGAYKVKSVGMNISNVYKLKFTLTGTVTETTKVYLNGEEVAVDGGVVYTDAITATGSKQVYTITIKIDGVETSKVEYNVDAYIAAKDEGSTVVEIVQAIANYSNAAIAYVTPAN